jgi:hypothetical protein
LAFTLQQQAQGEHYHETKTLVKSTKGTRRRGGILQLLLKSVRDFTPIIPSIILLLLLLSRCKILPSLLFFFFFFFSLKEKRREFHTYKVSEIIFFKENLFARQSSNDP